MGKSRYGSAPARAIGDGGLGTSETEITALLLRWRSGDRAAAADLMRAVYPVPSDLAGDVAGDDLVDLRRRG
jgi:hypothetical protein